TDSFSSAPSSFLRPTFSDSFSREALNISNPCCSINFGRSILISFDTSSDFLSQSDGGPIITVSSIGYNTSSNFCSYKQKVSAINYFGNNRKISEPNIICKLSVSCSANKYVLTYFEATKSLKSFGIEITSPGVKRKDSHSLSLGFIKPISASPSIQYVSSDAFGWYWNCTLSSRSK